MDILKSPLLTDLYQFTMMQAYFSHGMKGVAVFEFFVRKLPPSRGFLIAAGLEPMMDFLEELRFEPNELEYLEKTLKFSPGFIEYLAGFRFTGEVDAMQEGTVFFPDEPVFRVIAPITQAQLVESRLINIVNLHTMLTSKAVRSRLAARDDILLVDFGLRRTQGAEAGLAAARSSYIAGFAGTSTVIAQPLYGIPVYGTMAHSFIEACRGEKESFIDFALSNPGSVTLLIDTYDTLRGAEKVVETARELGKKGITVQAVRLDSGDLLELSIAVRKILDEGGFPNIRIFVSGNMDECSIKELLEKGAPIDGFGVGTLMDTSADAPYLECAYKLMEYDGMPRFKKSQGKATLPGRKQIFRIFRNGIMDRDVLGLMGEEIKGEQLLRRVMSGGKKLGSSPDLRKIVEHCRSQIATLPVHFRGLAAEPPYRVELSDGLIRLKKETEHGLFRA